MTDREEFLEIFRTHVTRPGSEKLLDWMDSKTDFFSAPASTRFHGACDGGLCAHSLNVYRVLHGTFFTPDEDSEETFAICALLHDLCKTNFYETEMRNQKTYDPEKVKAASNWQVKKDNAGQFIWESVPCYTINDKNPYGHGEKSVMMIEEFMRLTMEERYAIRWHMGMSDCTYNEVQAFNKSCEKFPLVLLLHVADQEASHFMEDTQKNKELFQKMDVPDDEFQEAEPV